MGVAEVLAEVVVSDFLQPAVDRLSEQLSRNIELTVKLMLDKEVIQRQIVSRQNEVFQEIKGEARILASDTAVSGRYKYDLQCLFPEKEGLKGFSGIRLNGAVIISGMSKENRYSGFSYTYNKWDWGKKVRDF